MAAITTRAGKGAALTNDEMDANFTNLNTAKMEKSSNLGDLTDAAQARSNLGLGNVDNTRDADKPVSTAVQTALDAKQDKATAVTKDSSTGAMRLPSGTTLQRPAAPQPGDKRWNTDLGVEETYNGSAWVAGGGGSGQMLGNAAVKAIAFFSQTISENLTIAAGTNGLTAGPVSVANGNTVTVADGSVWTIV